MNIVNFFQRQTTLVAGCRNGLLFSWDLEQAVDQSFRDVDGFKPILREASQCQQLAPSLTGLQNLQQTVIGFNSSAIYTTTIDPGAESFKIGDVITISFNDCRLSVLTMLSQEVVLLGTSGSKLVRYNIASQKVEKSSDVYRRKKDLKQTPLFFLPQEDEPEVTAIEVLRSRNSVLVALSNDSLYEVQLDTLLTVSEVKHSLQGLQSLVVSEKDDLIWLIGEDCLLLRSLVQKGEEWVISGGDLLGGAKIDQERYFVASIYPEIYWVFDKSEKYVMELSMRYSTCFQFTAVGPNRCLLVAGADGLIDVFWKNTHLLVLHPPASYHPLHNHD